MKALIASSLVFVASCVVAAQQIDIGPPPGRLVDLGGRKLHLHCTGIGSPTVVLEAGASSFAIDWSLVQPDVARTNRVCSYDRAGMGWSDARDAVDTPARVIQDLHALLAAGGERPPYVLVGASLGGMYVRLYQLEFPREVVGLVLVDPATEDRQFTMLNGEAVTIASLTAEQLRSTLPASGSFPVTRRSPQTGEPFNRLPAALYDVRVKIDQRLIDSFPPSVPAEVVRESSEGQWAGLARLLESRTDQRAPIRTTPSIVLTRGEGTKTGLAESHADVARLSTNSRHAVVAGAGHEIHLFVPAAVTRAIQDVVTAAREGGVLVKQ